MAFLKSSAADKRPCDFLFEVIKTANIIDYYTKRDEPDRIDNLRDLYSKARSQDKPEQNPQDALLDLLKYTSLSNTELDMLLDKRAKVPIITVHQAKGSEFDHVFIAGLQDGNFPNAFAVRNHLLDEEKRLFYVAITRAKKHLYLTWSQSSYYNKETHQSPLINAIPGRYSEYE
jgi:DNA helicase-2/ATP-dependent DNA helicase PcrA